STRTARSRAGRDRPRTIRGGAPRHLLRVGARALPARRPRNAPAPRPRSRGTQPRLRLPDHDLVARVVALGRSTRTRSAAHDPALAADRLLDALDDDDSGAGAPRAPD